MKKITIKLTEESINNAIREIDEYRNSLPKRIEMFVKLLAEEGRDLAVIEVESTAKYSFIGITQGIQAVTLGNGKALVVSTAPHSMFYEFGTGVVGKGNPHPNDELLATLGWNYDINEHGDLGWWYPTDETDGNPFKWIDDKGQLRAWTKGMESRPFMFNTARLLKIEAKEIAREVFKWD